MDSMPVYLGLLMGGMNLVAVDLCAALLMGFNYGKIPYLSNALRKMSNYPLSDLNEQEINVLLNGENIIPLLDCPTLHPFKPPEGWVGHIEKMEESSRFQRERVDKNC